MRNCGIISLTDIRQLKPSVTRLCITFKAEIFQCSGWPCDTECQDNRARKRLEQVLNGYSLKGKDFYSLWRKPRVWQGLCAAQTSLREADRSPEGHWSTFHWREDGNHMMWNHRSWDRRDMFYIRVKGKIRHWDYSYLCIPWRSRLLLRWVYQSKLDLRALLQDPLGHRCGDQMVLQEGAYWFLASLGELRAVPDAAETGVRILVGILGAERESIGIARR